MEHTIFLRQRSEDKHLGVHAQPDGKRAKKDTQRYGQGDVDVKIRCAIEIRNYSCWRADSGSFEQTAKHSLNMLWRHSGRCRICRLNEYGVGCGSDVGASVLRYKLNQLSASRLRVLMNFLTHKQPVRGICYI